MLARYRLSLFTALAAVLICSPVYADPKDGHGHGKGKHHEHRGGKHDRHNDHDHDGPDRVVVIQPADRVVIEHYVERDYERHCPPGLRKKHNGCMPPGQAKKRYVIGQPLQEVVVYHPVPQDVLVQLQPVPVGYQYVQVDRDVLLIAEGSKKVIDAITLFSAVGH